MKLNRKQKTILLIAVILLVVSFLFPPWLTNSGLTHEYEWFLAGGMLYDYDYTRYALQLLTLCLFTMGMLLFFKDET